jgi:hypothetical protein
LLRNAEFVGVTSMQDTAYFPAVIPAEAGIHFALMQLQDGFLLRENEQVIAGERISAVDTR